MAYQGLIPNRTARTRPVAGYHATEPSCEMRMTGGWFRARYSTTKAMERITWRMIRRPLFMNQIPVPDGPRQSRRSSGVSPAGGDLYLRKCFPMTSQFMRFFGD